MFLGLNAPHAFSAACAGVSATCAIFVALRDSRWRKSGLAAQLSDRITHAQATADSWFGTDTARKMRRDLDRHHDKLGEHSGRLDRCATKADVAEVRVAAEQTRTLAKHSAEGVDRIEGILIKRALNQERV